MVADAAPLLGRSSELSRLQALASGRLPAAALVLGEPGIGKSRLIIELIACWDGPVAVGTADARLTRPFGVLADALGHAATADSSAAPPAPVRRWLASLEATEPTDSAVHGDHARAAHLRAAVDAVAAWTTDGPALLALEDLHWADAETCAAVSTLVRRADLPVAVVGTARSGEASRPLIDLRADLARRLDCIELTLSGLPLRALEELARHHAGRRLDDRALLALRRRSGGNPLLAVELASAAGLDLGVGAGLDAGDLPASIAAAVTNRLEGCPPETVEVAEAVAALGGSADDPLLAAVLASDPEEVTRRLRTLTDRGLLTASVDGAIAFRHDLLREAVAARLLGPQRRRIHDRAYHALAARDASDHALLAHHAAEAGRSRELVVHAVEGARSRLRQGFAYDAWQLAERALDATPHAGQALALRRVAAEAARNLGSYGDAVVHAAACAELAAAAGDADALVDAELLLAELAAAEGALSRIDAHLQRAQAACRTAGSTARVDALGARLAMLAERHDEAIARAERALAGHAEPAVEASAQITRGTAVGQRDGADAAAPVLAAGRATAEACGDRFEAGRALLNSLTLRPPADDPEAAWAAYEEAVAYARAHDLDAIAGNIARCGADLAVAAGDQQRALQILDARLADELDPVEATAIAAKAGVLRVERGDVESASVLLAGHERAGQRVERHWARTYLRLLDVAVAAARQDDVAAALGRYRDVVGAAEHAQRAPRAAEAARRALDAGVDVVAVEAFLDVTLAAADAAPTPWRTQLAVALADARDDPEAALAAADGPLRSGQAPHLDADALLRLARAHRTAGDLPRARQHVADAVRLLRRWPGPRQRWAAQLAAELDGEIDAPNADVTALTPREREVVALLAAGASNQRIAVALGIAERTAAVHVSRILAKTGHPSRTAVATWAVRCGLDSAAADTSR